jgi:hypothetical protein
MINEHLLPNPFKQPGTELSNVLDNIERDLCARVIERDTTPLPAFLNDEFLERLEAEISAASADSAARKMQGRRIVSRLREQLKAFGR